MNLRSLCLEDVPLFAAHVLPAAAVAELFAIARNA
jgi:hypothetical protein